ncbi:hypothetical protein [Lacipirellula parvula]|uniref:hypothetical protein n=1 Tax=Lacipirellula parvula TaxID=2650471 RepID=UPI001561C731|nr:hypothetical protein [Lacipirellula parvula]
MSAAEEPHVTVGVDLQRGVFVSVVDVLQQRHPRLGRLVGRMIEVRDHAGEFLRLAG